MRLQSFLATAGLVAYAKANSDFIILPINNSNAWIQEASATLILPNLPELEVGEMALLSSVKMDEKASFLKGYSSSSLRGSQCNSGDGSWCNFASTQVDLKTTDSDGVTASPGTSIKTHYKLNHYTNLWEQNIYIDGQLHSSVNSSKFQQGEIFQISAECAPDVCARIPVHKWEDIYILLNQADEGFKHSGSWGHGATGGDMTTRDGGMSWNLTTVEVPAQDVAPVSGELKQ